MLCFDPTRGIDVGTKRQIYALLRELADDGAGDPLLHLRAAPRSRSSATASMTLLRRPRSPPSCPAAAADEAALLRAMHGLVEDGGGRVSDARTPAPRGFDCAASRAGTAGRSASRCCSSCSILYWRSATNLPWGPFDVQSLVIDALPLAFAAMGQAIVIISGGIDLSIGSMMSLINVRRREVHGEHDELRDGARCFALALLLLGAAIVGAITGGIVVRHGVADIIVTLADAASSGAAPRS